MGLKRRGRAEVPPADISQPWRRELDALVEIAGILTRPIAFDHKCGLMLEVLAHTANAEVSGLRTLDEAGTGLRRVAFFAGTTSSDPEAPNFTIPVSTLNCPIARCLRKRRVLVIDDVTKLDNPLPDYFSPHSYSPQICSLLVCPVQAGETVIGVLAFSAKAVNNLNSEPVQLMTAITSTMGVMTENASLQEVRILADEKIVRLAQALEFTDDAIALADNLGNLEYPNKASQEMPGDTPILSPGDSGGLPTPKEGEEPDRLDGLFMQALNGGWIGEVQGLDKNGNRIDISLATNNVTDKANRIMGHITVGRDVTESRRMQRDLLRLNQEREVEAYTGRIVSSPLEMFDVFAWFSEEFAKIISSDFQFITGVDPEQKTFTVNFWHLPEEWNYTFENADSYLGTMVGAVVESGRCVVFNVGDADWPAQILERLRPMSESGQTSFVAVPLVSQDQIVGALGMSRAREPYTEDDQERATRTGQLIFGAISCSRLCSRQNSNLRRTIHGSGRKPTMSAAGSGCLTCGPTVCFTSAYPSNKSGRFLRRSSFSSR